MNRSIFFIGTVFLCLFISCKDDDQTEKTEPEACFDFRSGPYYTGDSIQFTNCSSNAESYQWNLNGGLISDKIDFTFTPNNPGEYRVKLSVENKDEEDTLSQVFEVEDYNGFVLDKSYPKQSASPKSIIKMADGSYLVSYVSFNVFEPSRYYHLLKINGSFDVEWEWSRRYGANLYGSTLFENDNGDIQFTQNNWISGFSETLVETFTATGQNINSRTITNNENGLIDYMIDGDSIIYVGYSGPRYDYDLFIHITDHQGSALDTKLISFDEKVLVGKSIRKNSDGYLLLGWSNIEALSDEKPKINLLQLDHSLSKSWEMTYNIEGTDADRLNGFDDKWNLISNEDNSMMIFAYPTVMKLDQEGNKIWSKNYRPTEEFLQGLVDGGVIKVGSEFIFGYDNVLIKIDQEGNEKWRKEIPTGTVVQLLQETDHFVILENRKSYYSSEDIDGELTAYQVSLIKMDFDGNYLDF
ncbi:PKD domain-containing protein [Ekhidna sp.]|uniref:PKD domain-containing protein n=1 Tax=Ekhidna sp. TaxID=2608089 RepID=UPI003C7DC552